MDKVPAYMDEQRNPENPELKQFNEEYEDFMFAPTNEKYINMFNTYKELPDEYLDIINNKMKEVIDRMTIIRDSNRALAQRTSKTRSGGSRRRRNISSRFKKSRKSGRKSSRRHNKKSSRRYRR